MAARLCFVVHTGSRNDRRQRRCLWHSAPRWPTASGRTGIAEEPTIHAAADLYGDLEPTPRVANRDYLPGLAVAGAATLSAAYISDRYGAPLTLMALLIGLALNFLSADARLTPGLALASRTLLRWGIVLVGVRVTLAQIVGLGPVALLAVLAIVTATIGAGVLAARRLGFSSAFGVLAGGAVAICGASAAMAFASVLGDRRINQAQLTLVLVGISAMSSLAMFFYPIIAHRVGMDDTQAGFMLGAAIHDVAQSLGAGYSFSQFAGATAAVVKLTRVALLAPAIAAAAMFFPGEGGAGSGSQTGGGAGGAGKRWRAAITLPWFVTGFFVLAAVNSTGIIPSFVANGTQQFATALLACAVTATGMRSPMQSLLVHGPKPLLVIAVSTLVALMLATSAAIVLIR